MGNRDDDLLLGKMYDAAFDPGLWVSVMEDLSKTLSGHSACMTTLDVFTGQGSGYAALVPSDTMDTYLSTWTQNNPLHEMGDACSYMQHWRPATIRYEDWIDRQALNRTEFFNEFLRPIGAENGIMMGLALVGTNTVTVNIARPFRHDVFDDDEVALARRWQGHLSRAVRLGQTVQIGQTALDAVDQLIATTTRCLFFLDQRGRVQRMSAGAEAMLVAGRQLTVCGGVLTAVRSDEDVELRRLVARATVRDATGSPSGSMILASGVGDRVELDIAPLGPRSTAHWSSAPVVLVTATHPHGAVLPIDARIRIRFGLTPAEARVAMAVLRGFTLRDTSETLSVSINTVRAQLSAVFAKTGCRRQADLVRILSRIEQTGH